MPPSVSFSVAVELALEQRGSKYERMTSGLGVADVRWNSVASRWGESLRGAAP